ncbi:MAG: putative metal-binding motif-containing protein [Myxococcales bacterium]|nr:putative metal-binding motif-containing protein [Myxococcales bacterium]
MGIIAAIPLSCGGEERTFGSTTGGAAGTAGSGASSGTGGAGTGGAGTGGTGAGGTGGSAGTGDAGKTCSNASDCDDGLLCNGTETCEGTFCKAGTNATDGTPCVPPVDGGVGDGGVTYSCVAGACLAVCVDDADCDDNDVCTGTETCNPTTKTCQKGTPLVCDDKSDCTENKCDPTTGCFHPLIDADGDNHAATSLGACGDDCNDSDPTIYTGAAELCDGKDNNCDSKTDEIAPSWYPDCDKDTFAPLNAPGTQSCSAPASAPTTCASGGWTSKAPGPGTTDCFDTNAAVHPMTASESNAAWSSKAIPGATTAVDFDYNCDGVEEKRFNTGYVSTAASCTLQCGSSGICYCAGTAGYTGAVPACGTSANYTSCSMTLGCKRTAAAPKIQECR